MWKRTFWEAGNNHVIIDIEGIYGMTQGAMGIKINNLTEGTHLRDALLSNKFNKLLCSCLWGNFRIDWRLFTYFKKDFLNDFINEEPPKNVMKDNKKRMN